MLTQFNGFDTPTAVTLSRMVSASEVDSVILVEQSFATLTAGGDIRGSLLAKVKVQLITDPLRETSRAHRLVSSPAAFNSSIQTAVLLLKSQQRERSTTKQNSASSLAQRALVSKTRFQIATPLRLIIVYSRLRCIRPSPAPSSMTSRTERSPTTSRSQTAPLKPQKSRRWC